MITLRKITLDNRRLVFNLEVSEEQRKFVASNLSSVATAYVLATNGGHPMPFAIYNDEIVVGFVLIAYGITSYELPAVAENNYTIIRFMMGKQYQNQGLSLGDLINEGNLGLIKAAQRFDETRGFKFISYAVWWIRQSILQALAEQSRIVRLPLNRVGSLNKISKTFSELEQKFEREPSPDELAEVLEVSTSEVVDTLKISGRHISMDAPFVQGEENSLLDVLENDSEDTPDAGLINDSLRREVQRALSTLTQREADVVTLYFGLNGEHTMTLEEIGEKFNLTRERVRQIKEKAIRRLRHTSRSKALKPYLG